MNLTILKEALKKGYETNGIKVDCSYCTKDFLIPICEKHLKSINESDGNAIQQLKQINSSAALAVYYHLMLNTVSKELCFEKKVAVPLKGARRKANLDVKYEVSGHEKDCLVFVESKFLEPYYSRNEVNSPSYFDISRYPDMDETKRKKWKKLMIDAQEYKYYNFSQMCRHLMAIYREYPIGDNGRNVILKSLSWSITDKFLEFVEDKYKDALKKRHELIHEEISKAEGRINKFLADIQWQSLTFITETYNDSLDRINKHPQFEEFKKRYFL